MDDREISYVDLVKVIRNLKPGNGAFYFFNNACELGNLDLCQACLDAGIDINVTEKHSKNTLIMETIINNKLTVKTAEWLISHGAAVIAKDPYGFTALTFACDAGNFELAKFLLEKGAVIRDSDFGKTDLIIAIECGNNQEIVELLLNTGFYEDKKFELEVAFSRAIDLELTDIVKVLLEHGVSANTFFYGVPALHDAVENRSIDIVKILLENGADVNAIRKDTASKYRGWYTPLDIVDEKEPIYQLLLKYGGKATTNEQKKQFEHMIHTGYAYKAFIQIRKMLDED